MSEYTPTIGEIRAEYASWPKTQAGRDTKAAEFDRALAAHDAEVRAGVVTGEPEWEYAIHSAKGEHLYPVDEQDRPMTTTLEEVRQALGDRDPDYWDQDDVIVGRLIGSWKRVGS